MKKTIYGTVIGVILVVVIGYFVANAVIKGKVESFLKSGLSENVDMVYDDLFMNTFTGNISVEGIQLSLKNKSNAVIHTTMKVNELSLLGFSYWDYFIDDQIKLEEIDIDQNQIIYHKDKYVPTTKNDSVKRTPLASINKSVHVKSLQVGRTSFKIFQQGTDSLFFSVSSGVLAMKDIKTDADRIQKKIPISYSDVTLLTDSIYLKPNRFETFRAASIELQDDDIQITDFQIVPEFDKSTLSRKLNKERDHITLNVPQIEIKDYQVGFNASRLSTTAAAMVMQQPEAVIYRDKLVADDNSFKPLYSKMLRDLTFDLMIDSVMINQSSITYQEKVKADKPAGEIMFTDLDFDIATIGNTQEKGIKTTITADGVFQESSNLHVDWSFDVHDSSDTFRFSGSVAGMPAPQINSFTQPNLGIGFEGEIDKVFFDITGDNLNSNTKMRMRYDEFKIDVMKKNSNGINNLLTGIANIFVSKDSDDQEGDFREGKGDADRDTTKSIFNFIWKSLLSGLIKTMT
jgi:hypothetical protein